MDEVLVDLKGFYRAMMDRDRLSDLSHPEQYYVDPESEQAQKALQLKTQAAQVAQQKREALMTQAVGLEQLGKALEKYVADQRTQFDYWNAILHSEIEEAKIVGSATTELLVAREKPKGAASELAEPQSKPN